MARNARAMLAATSVAVLSIVVAVSGYPLVAAGVFALGMLGLAAVRERDLEAPQGDAQAKLDRAIEDHASAPAEPVSATSTATLPPRPAALGLPTWQPSSFTPPPDPDFGPSADAPTAFAPEPRPEPRPALPAGDPSTDSAWDTWPEAEPGPVTREYDEGNPLADLDRLDEVDPVAEVQRLERLGPAASSATFSFSSAPKPVNEEAVRTDEDIMAASHATELQVSTGPDSELARLLAKVQQRLAAYE